MTRARKASLKKPTEGSRVEDLMQLLSKMRTGDIAPADRDFAKRCLSRYRAKYLAGYLSDATARRLGLIDTGS